MTASSACSPELWRLLTNDRMGFFESVANIAKVDRELLGSALINLEPFASPCGSKAVITILAPLVSLYGVPDKSEAEWRTFWGFYTKALGDLPAESVAKAVEEYVARHDSEFFPKPGPLRAICDRHAAPVRMAMSRLRKALA